MDERIRQLEEALEKAHADQKTDFQLAKDTIKKLEYDHETETIRLTNLIDYYLREIELLKANVTRQNYSRATFPLTRLTDLDPAYKLCYVKDNNLYFTNHPDFFKQDGIGWSERDYKANSGEPVESEVNTIITVLTANLAAIQPYQLKAYKKKLWSVKELNHWVTGVAWLTFPDCEIQPVTSLPDVVSLLIERNVKCQVLANVIA